MYTTWIWHVELQNMRIVSQTENVDVDMGDWLEEMIHDVGKDSFKQTYSPLYYALQSDLKKPLPKNNYEKKKILCPVGIEYQKIHACLNDCIL